MVRFELLAGDPRAVVCALRQRAYTAKYPEERLNVELLQWNEIDQTSMHFGAVATESNALISSIRLTVSNSIEVFKKVLLAEFDQESDKVPFAILSRAATDPEFKGAQINFSLRHFVLKFVFEKGLSDQVFGLVADDARRIESLEKIGYTKTLNQNPWKGCILRPPGTSYILRLNKSDFAEGSP